MGMFLVIYSRGENWMDGVIIHNQPNIPEHAVYGQQVFDQEKLLIAGPFTDGSGGASIIEAESEEEVRSIIDEDPAVKSKVLTYDIREWSTVFNKYVGRNPQFKQEYLDHKHQVQEDLNIK